MENLNRNGIDLQPCKHLAEPSCGALHNLKHMELDREIKDGRVSFSVNAKLFLESATYAVHFELDDLDELKTFLISTEGILSEELSMQSREEAHLS